MTAREFYELHQIEDFLSKGEIIKMMEAYLVYLEEKKKDAVKNISQQGAQC